MLQRTYQSRLSSASEKPRNSRIQTAIEIPQTKNHARNNADMDINRTSGKRVSASQRDLVNAGSDQATVRKLWKALAAVVFGLLLSVPGWAQAQYRFIKIDVPEATATAANGNSTHEIVGQFDDAEENTHGFVWNKGAPTTINVTGAVFTILNGINAAGDVMGTYGDEERNHAFVMIKGLLTTLDPPGDSSSQGGFINAKGEAVGTYRDGNPNPPDQVNKRRGFIWRKGMFTNTSINVPGDHPLFGTVALGINDIGEIVGNYVHEDDKIIPGNPDTTPPIPPSPSIATASCGAEQASSPRLTCPTRIIRSRKESTTLGRSWGLMLCL